MKKQIALIGFLVFCVSAMPTSAWAAFFQDGNIFLTVWEGGEAGKELTIDLQTIGYSGFNIDNFASTDFDGDGQNGFATITTPDLSFFNTSNVDDLYVALWGATQNLGSGTPRIPGSDQGDYNIFFSSTLGDANLLDIESGEIASFQGAVFGRLGVFSGRDRLFDSEVGGSQDLIAEEGVVGQQTDTTGAFADTFITDPPSSGAFGAFAGGGNALFNEIGLPDHLSGFLSLEDSGSLFLYHYFNNAEFQLSPIPRMVLDNPELRNGGPVFEMSFTPTDDNRLEFTLQAAATVPAPAALVLLVCGFTAFVAGRRKLS
jgi:hypothetical protein